MFGLLWHTSSCWPNCHDSPHNFTFTFSLCQLNHSQMEVISSRIPLALAGLSPQRPSQFFFSYFQRRSGGRNVSQRQGMKPWPPHWHPNLNPPHWRCQRRQDEAIEVILINLLGELVGKTVLMLGATGVMSVMVRSIISYHLWIWTILCHCCYQGAFQEVNILINRAHLTNCKI